MRTSMAILLTTTRVGGWLAGRPLPAVSQLGRRVASNGRLAMSSSTAEKQPKPQKQKQKQKGGGGGGGGARSAITTRDADFSQWYQDVIAASDLVDQSPVKGCMVIKPNGMALWDAIREDMDKRIKANGASNAYFPLFIPVSFLSKEAEHVEGFAKECAVVTHHRLRSVDSEGGAAAVEPDPDAKLEEELIVRPTSETVIWHMFQKWIMSYRDLPLKINQWANVVRWELRTRPFLRSSEFLWQEGHTAHATKEEAIEQTVTMLDEYVEMCETLLAMPVVKGVKSPTERFAGADDTYTIEALMQNGWALQSGTSHFLGQNFAKAFDVVYQTKDNTQEHVWATSWGVSTRLIGALVMTHSDDAGLVLPPRVAPQQVVIVPISPKGPEKAPEQHAALMEYVDRAAGAMRERGIRVAVDDRWHMKPGPKFYEWERRGVPIRIEVGPRDMEAGSVLCAKRTGGDKFKLPLDDDFGATVTAALDSMHDELLGAARDRLAERTFEVSSYAEMEEALRGSSGASAPGFFLAPWCDDAVNEDKVKAETKATIRCFPTAEQHKAEGKDCFFSGRPATHMALFARAF